MNGFSTGNGGFSEEMDSEAFNLGGPVWDSMITMPSYDDELPPNASSERRKRATNHHPSNNFLQADSPQYDLSSGVSSPGLSDNNIDTLSSTSLEDRNDFENLINYDAESSKDYLGKLYLFSRKSTLCSASLEPNDICVGILLVQVKPEMSQSHFKTQLDDAGMTLYGNMDWTHPDDAAVYTSIVSTPEQIQDTMWGSTKSPPSDITSTYTPQSQSMSPKRSKSASLPPPGGIPTPPQEVAPEALLVHAGLYGGYLAPKSSIDYAVPKPRKSESNTDQIIEMEADDESMSRFRGMGGKGKRKMPTNEWDVSQEEAHRRLYAASLENQFQTPQTVNLENSPKKKTLNMARHLKEQPMEPLPLPFTDEDPMPSGFLARPRPRLRLLWIGCDFPLKSRVETQTTIRFIVGNLPEGVKRLHMPPHTISRPKQMLKDKHVPSADTLEMDCYVVCETAYKKVKERLARDAFTKACKPPARPNPHLKLRRYDEDDDEKANTRERGPSVIEMSMTDPNNPLNGGEVWVCAGCMDREGKRSTRKKVKRPLEEKAWWELESRRIVLMNTQELRDFCVVPRDQCVPLGDDVTGPQYYVDSPVRIACYCRHQHEKIGYR